MGPSTGRALRLRCARFSARAVRSAAWQDRHPPVAPIGCSRPQEAQVPIGWHQRNRRQARHIPLVSRVRSPQSAHAPVVS